jgi:S-adenosylmethionine:tRNA ribosyltransferase-isomerase
VQTSDFDYNLPQSFIAQTPMEPRDASRLLVFNRAAGRVEHRIFREIGQYLEPGDLLVLNETRVIPARLLARKPTGGRVELLLLRRQDERTWQCLIGGKGLRFGKSLQLEGGPSAEIVEQLDGAERLVRFSEPIEPLLARIGHVPLPPYIHEKLQDPERYQTVYARTPGSAAAPTAGLHFTSGLLDDLRARGVQVAYVTLHVGLDTFAPVEESTPDQHTIHTEWCELPRATAEAVNNTRARGGRVIAVGTTSVRTLESSAVPLVNDQSWAAAAAAGPARGGRAPGVRPYSGQTFLYILPGYEFRVVDALITNFHLPRSTLIMLVSALIGRERLLETYELAKREGYRFYSFGDAMLIL